MRTWLIVLLAAIGFEGPLAVGQESKDDSVHKGDGSQKPTVYPDQDDKEEANGFESQYARRDDRATVQLGIGMIMGGISGTQIDGYYSLSPNLQIGLSVGSGELDLTDELNDDSDIVVEKAVLSGSMVGVQSRYFLGNSFFLRTGLGQRNIAAELDVRHKSIGYGIKGKAEAKSIAINFGLANQWQWENGFVLGCEWIGLSQPLYTTSSEYAFEEYGSVTGVNTKDSVTSLKDEFEDLAKALGESGSLRLLILTLGWAF